MSRLALPILSLSLAASFFACADDPIGKVGAAIKVDPLSIDLGDTPIGVLKKHEVSISNVGSVTLDVASVALVEEEGVPFSLDLSAVPEKEAPFSLVAGEKTTVELRHIPRDRVLDSGLLRIVSDDPDDGRVEVEIAQTGAGAPRVLVVPDVDQADAEADTPGGISTSVQQIAFGLVGVGVLKNVTEFVVNGGDGNIPLEITSIAIVDAVSAENLTVTADPDPSNGSVLLPLLGVKSRAAPTRSIHLTLSWQPPASGAGLQATLRIMSSDPAHPMLDLPITGSSNSQNPPILRLVPANGLTFPMTGVGMSADLSFTAYNDGAAELMIQPLSITNDASGVFSLIDVPAAVTIQPGLSHAFGVRFTPASGANYTASIPINSNDPAQSTADYPLAGNSMQTMMCTPAIPDPHEPDNDDCTTSIDRGSFALDIDMQQSIDWNDSMLYATGDSDWNYVNLSVVAGCDLTGYDLHANVTLPSGEQAEVCMDLGDCASPQRHLCGMGSTGIFLSPFTAGPDMCNMFNNMLPVRMRVRHTGGEPTCTNYTLHFTAR